MTEIRTDEIGGRLVAAGSQDGVVVREALDHPGAFGAAVAAALLVRAELVDAAVALGAAAPPIILFHAVSVSVNSHVLADIPRGGGLDKARCQGSPEAGSSRRGARRDRRRARERNGGP